MTQPILPTSPLTPAPDWRAFAAVIRDSLIEAHPAWATVSGVITTHPPYAAPTDAPAALGASPHQAKPATSPASTATSPAKTADAAPRTDLDDILDFVEAEAAATAALLSDALPPLPDGAGKDATVHTLRPAAALAVARLAATFPSPAALYEALSAPGSLTVLAVNTPGLDETVYKVVDHLLAHAPFWPEDAPLPLAVRAEETVLSKDNRKSGAGPVGQMVSTVRKALETRRPVVAVALATSTLPSALRALKPRMIDLTPLDRAMLAGILADAYPDTGNRTADDATALAPLPDDTRCKALGPDDLVLALRSPTLDGAIAALVEATMPAASEGPGLKDFPLPQEVREPLEQLIDDLRAWKAGTIPWRDVSRGILLAGPPGTGKTEAARLVAREAGIGMIAGSVATWQSRGERASGIVKAMKDDFAMAAAEAPCIVFIDEVDAFGDRARRDHNSSWTEYVVAALLECLDGYAQLEGVVPMAATNNLERIDAAIRRPGRFDRVLHLGNPTPDLLPAAIRWQAWPDLADTDLTGLAAQAVGLSGADVAGLVRAARARARRARRALSLDDLTAALGEIRPPMPEALRWQVAVHEAGHAVVAASTGIARPGLLALQGNGGITHARRLMIGQRRSEMDAALTLDLAGRAAEIAVFGEPSGGAGGDSDSDLARASLLAVAIEASLGLGDSLTWEGSPQAVLERLALDADLRSRVEVHLRRAEDRALRIVEANRPLMEEMAAALCRSALLTGPELEALLARVSPEPAIGTPKAGAGMTPPHVATDPARNRPELIGNEEPAPIPPHRAGPAVQGLHAHPDRADNTNAGPDPDLSRLFAA